MSATHGEFRDPHTVRIAPQLYVLAYEQLAKPFGITVEQAINRMLAVTIRPAKEPEHADTFCPPEDKP